jgi:hypothetical protein
MCVKSVCMCMLYVCGFSVLCEYGLCLCFVYVCVVSIFVSVMCM